MTTGVPVLDIISGAQAALAEVAPSFDDERSVPQHDDPNRYVWVLDSVRSSDVDEIGGNPRALLTEFWNVQVHCWGIDKARSLRLRQALITVLTSCVGPGNLEFIRTTFRGGEAHHLQGWVSIVEVDIELPLFAARFAQLGGEVIDDKLETVNPEATGWDATGAVVGDGTIVYGEET